MQLKYRVTGKFSGILNLWIVTFLTRKCPKGLSRVIAVEGDMQMSHSLRICGLRSARFEVSRYKNDVVVVAEGYLEQIHACLHSRHLVRKAGKEFVTFTFTVTSAAETSTSISISSVGLIRRLQASGRIYTV